MEKKKKTSKNNQKIVKKEAKKEQTSEKVVQNVSKIEEREPKLEQIVEKVNKIEKMVNTGKKTPLGIVIPYYENSDQARDLLKDLLKKIEEQLKKTDKVKVVIVEDGQESLWLNSHENEKLAILRLKTNNGVSVARNYGIDHFRDKCDYIGFIDADDDISDDYLEKLGAYASDGTHDVLETRVSVNGTMTDKLDYNKHRNGVWGYAFKTEILKGKKFNEELRFGEDAEFMYSVVDLRTQRKVEVPAVYYYVYGRNPNSLSRIYNAKHGKF